MGKEMTLELELPWPPSVNHYYRHVGSRVLISRDGRKYRELVTTLVNRNGFRPFQGRISLHAEFYPPDRRRRDLDNVGGKVLLDTLQAAGLFKDDSQIKRILLEMRTDASGRNGLYKDFRMEERRQNGGRRRQIVQEFVKNITDDTRRLVCFLYMNGYKDGAIRRILKIDRQRLEQIKT